SHRDVIAVPHLGVSTSLRIGRPFRHVSSRPPFDLAGVMSHALEEDPPDGLVPVRASEVPRRREELRPNPDRSRRSVSRRETYARVTRTTRGGRIAVTSRRTGSERDAYAERRTVTADVTAWDMWGKRSASRGDAELLHLSIERHAGHPQPA